MNVFIISTRNIAVLIGILLILPSVALASPTASPGVLLIPLPFLLLFFIFIKWLRLFLNWNAYAISFVLAIIFFLIYILLIFFGVYIGGFLENLLGITHLILILAVISCFASRKIKGQYDIIPLLLPSLLSIAIFTALIIVQVMFLKGFLVKTTGSCNFSNTQDQCFRDLAIKAENINNSAKKVCGYAENQEYCKYSYTVGKKNIALCNELDSSWRKNCLQELAEFDQTGESCLYHERFDEIGKCLAKTRHIELCTKLITNNDSDDYMPAMACFREAGNIKDIFNMCDDLSGNDALKSGCYRGAVDGLSDYKKIFQNCEYENRFMDYGVLLNCYRDVVGHM